MDYPGRGHLQCPDLVVHGPDHYLIQYQDNLQDQETLLFVHEGIDVDPTRE